MKIVIATDNFLPRWDGIARFLSEIIPRMSKEYQITVIAPDFGKSPDIKNVKIVKIPLTKMQAGDFRIAKFQYSKIKKVIKEDADAVFTQTIGPIGICAILSAKTLFKPVISFIHNIEWELFPKAVSFPLLKKIAYPVTKKFVRFLYNKSNLLIVPSEGIADMLTWQKITTRKKVVHLGVHTDKFEKENKPEAKKTAGFNPRDFVIGYHGRLGREKDLKTLLRAFVRTRSKHDNVKLLIVGSGAKDVEKLFRNKEGVVFTGEQNNVIPWIQAMDVYVIPSLTETTSLSTLEAMSCEVAVIATNVGFIKDYLKNGVNGFFFEKQNPYDLAKKIELLISDSELRAKLGREARKTVIESFNWEIASERIMDGINFVINKKSNL